MGNRQSYKGRRIPMWNRAGHLLRHAVRWLMGGVAYGGIEIFYRGYTHWTMIVLAAALCVPLDLANDTIIEWDTPLWLQALMGGSIITAAEFASGLILNVWLGLDIWDYSDLPGNLLGQICPQFWALWCLLALPTIIGFDWLCWMMDDGEAPRYRIF